MKNNTFTKVLCYGVIPVAAAVALYFVGQKMYPRKHLILY